MRYLKYTVCHLIVLITTLFSLQPTVASILPLDGNPAALVSGTETFPNDILSADIGYAVFGPGVFTSEAAGGIFDNPQLSGFDPGEGFAGSDPVFGFQCRARVGKWRILPRLLSWGKKGLAKILPELFSCDQISNYYN